MKKRLSITCTNCGKLNSINQKYCTSCGHQLPAVNQKVMSQNYPKKKRTTIIIMALLVLVIIGGLLSFSIKQNQQILRTSSLNVTPFKVEFFDQHNHLVMTRYLRGVRRHSTNGYARGKLAISKTLRGKRTTVSYIDSRAKKSFVIYSNPKITFYYEKRYGKFNDYGRCQIANNRSIKSFRMIKLDSGTN